MAQAGSTDNKKSLTDPKWQPSGWRIEQKYSKGVLIGNWSEDRLGKFERGRYLGNSTHRGDFQCYAPTDYQPDVSTRRRGLLRNDGLNKDHIFTHHGGRYMHNMISLYDQQFDRKYTVGSRRWDRHRLAWLPEASDHPVQGASTNFGLKEEVEKKWKRLQEIESHGDYNSLYSVTYRSPPKEAKTTPTSQLATPRHLSSHLHPHRINKDLHLRGSPLIMKPEVVDSRLLQYKKFSATV